MKQVMKQRLTIGKKITALVACLIAVAMLQGGLALLNLRALDANILGLTDGAMPGLQNMAAVSGDLASFRGDIFEHMLAATEKDSAEVETRQQKTRQKLAKDMDLYEKYISQAEDREHFKDLREKQAAFFNAWENGLRPISRKHKALRSFQVYGEQVRPRFNQQMATVNVMREWNSESGLRIGKAATSSSASAQFWTKLILLGMVLAGAGFSWFIVRGLNRDLGGIVNELTQGGDQVASAAGQIAGSSQALSRGATEQAASLEEISASIEEMAAMTSRNAENSSQAMAMMLETAAQVERSNRALQDMMASMSAIKESSERVGKINKTIDEIAFQTNILALNAAVEAARAGSAGMGFAVVAGEVRNLAQRSAVAAKDTAVLIEHAVASSGEGAEQLEHVAEAIRAITEGAVKVKNLVDEVNEASRQQAQGIDQVAQAITQINTVTQTNAASAEESAAASQLLTAQSQEMRRLMSSLREMVEGTQSEAEMPATRQKVAGNKPVNAAVSSSSSSYSFSTSRPHAAPSPASAFRPSSAVVRKAPAAGFKTASSSTAGSATPARVTPARPTPARPVAGMNAGLGTGPAPGRPTMLTAAVLTSEDEFPMESDPEGGFHSF